MSIKNAPKGAVIKTERSARLLKLEAEMSREFRGSFIGKETEVLLEEPVVIDGTTYMTGHTKEYVNVAVSGRIDEKNSFVKGVLKEFLTDDIIYLAENNKLG